MSISILLIVQLAHLKLVQMNTFVARWVVSIQGYLSSSNRAAAVCLTRKGCCCRTSITAPFIPDTSNSTLTGVESHGPNENLHVSILKADCNSRSSLWFCNNADILQQKSSRCLIHVVALFPIPIKKKKKEKNNDQEVEPRRRLPNHPALEQVHPNFLKHDRLQNREQ